MVSYNAMLPQVSTPETIGRVSGFGWAMGYFGGIFLLLICYVGFMRPMSDGSASASAGGLNIRAVVVLLGHLVRGFRNSRADGSPGITRQVPSADGWAFLPRIGYSSTTSRLLFKRDRNSVTSLSHQLFIETAWQRSSAFGAILAVSVYGLAQSTVLIFGIAANVVAALGALSMGAVEDRIGPKKVIMISLVGLISTSLILLFAHGTTAFWIFGLILTLWVGPAQSSSRAFMARIAPVGREGEMFGLYATTGRAASFLAPALFALFSGLFTDRVGIVGIALVLLAGTIAMAGVKSPPRRQVQVSE